MKRLFPALAFAAVLAGCLLAGFQRGASATGGQADSVSQIRAECLERSEVMATLLELTDVIGPRLTGSPNMHRANEWTRDRLTAWGLKNAALEPWGEFGRGWSLERFSAQVVAPQAIPLVAYPKAWSPGLRRPIQARLVYLNAVRVADLEKYRGRLKGAIVLTQPPRSVQVSFEPTARRRSAEELEALRTGTPGGRGRPRGGGDPAAARDRLELARRRLAFLIEERAAAIVEPGTQGDGGAVFVQATSYPQTAGENAAPARPWSVQAPRTLPQVVLSTEDYNRLVRMLLKGMDVQMLLDLQVRFHTSDLTGYNTIAEIPGSDLAHEVVMLGGHLDSWHTGTGATDNAAGVAACMEAVRVISRLGLRPRRTIRIALWTGEEQGLLGSRAYVARHFATRGASGPGTRTAEYDRLAGYFNLDVGAGRIRGIHINGHEAVRSLFQSWLRPFNDLGADTISPSRQGGTDHNPFEDVGLPGFQFIQDQLEYFNRTHHSNLDVYDRVIEEDMRVSSAILAAFVYNTAMLDRPLPRRVIANPPDAPTTGR